MNVLFLLSFCSYLIGKIKLSIKKEDVMIKTIIKREVLSYLKNPMYYIGAILVFMGVYSSVSPYLQIHYFEKPSEIRTLENHSELADADVSVGYIPTTKEEQYEMGLDGIYMTLVESLNMSPEEANQLILKLRGSKMSILETVRYMEENYSYYNADYHFYNAQIKQATVEEANNYIKESLSEKTYTNYFSRKYADYMGVYIIFYVILMFAFLYMKDSKKDIYELLHTKPIKPWQYITGKIFGGMTAMLFVVGIITGIFNILAMRQGIAAGFPVSIWDIWFGVIIYLIPNLFIVICVYTFIAVLFKNPLPGVPALVLYMIYSNMGTRMEDGSFGYKIRKLAILVRFPDLFFETITPGQAVINQLSLATIALLITIISILIWKRRRVY
jgi:ABC-2 type transport system permease protein